MFLKSLQLLGFKTFARQTEIQFDGGVTAIVGPNGSGKTNIVDSVKWVLGAGQARDLRGKKMEEVIYAGGERRSRASYAEVTMVFDNTAGRLPVDYHEVAIKRRIERDGDSDYYLNGTKVRRRDLLHLLSSTGLTVDSYAIIDQHDIEHIVVCSPAERRQLLEEAAQVRGVKARRQEAVQKLEELAANLLRLEDLKSELAPRLEALKVQAEAAREASQATSRLELLRGSIVWEEWREARDAHRKASTQAQNLEKRLIEARELARTAEDEFQTGRTEMQAAQDRRLARQRTLGQLRLQLSEAQHRLQLAEERAENRTSVAESARRSAADANTTLNAAKTLKTQLVAELAEAERMAASIEAPASAPEADTVAAHDARRAAEQARRNVSLAASELASVRTRREFQQEQAAHSAGDEDAVGALTRLQRQLESVESLSRNNASLTLRQMLTAKPGYEELVEAVLGPLLDVTAVEALTTRRDELQRRMASATETVRLLTAAQEAEKTQAAKVAELEALAVAAEEHASKLGRDLEEKIRELADQRAAYQQRELWRERVDSVRRQVASVEDDVKRLQHAMEEHQEQVQQADAAAAQARSSLPELKEIAGSAREALATAEHDAPEDEAEMAESARKLVALEEARIDSRLREGNLVGNLELIARETELLQARMDEIRSRLPDGVAPEEIPGGKSREREMRAIEKRLIEIGPTNALAEQEFRELEERYQNLATQLEDITAARADLEDLIDKLRQEEESRYEAVFGAVAANFHEYFSELNPGGRATLRHAEGDDGPRTGVEILVQPPRKRLQNVTLLSSGERSLAALALVLALDEVNPSPFTILDEVDAALDDANVDRFGQMVARLGAQRQFLVITHNHVTMSYASTLYGIHLDESGSSHLVSVRLQDIRKPAARAATTLQAG